MAPHSLERGDPLGQVGRGGVPAGGVPPGYHSLPDSQVWILFQGKVPKVQPQHNLINHLLLPHEPGSPRPTGGPVRNRAATRLPRWYDTGTNRRPLIDAWTTSHLSRGRWQRGQVFESPRVGSCRRAASSMISLARWGRSLPRSLLATREARSSLMSLYIARGWDPFQWGCKALRGKGDFYRTVFGLGVSGIQYNNGSTKVPYYRRSLHTQGARVGREAGGGVPGASPGVFVV
jgi:hypothetical protein